MPKFDVGGYTGDGGRYEPAGVVHRGEFVLSASAVSRLPRSYLEGLNDGRLPGFARGGYVSSLPSQPATNANATPVINFITPPGVGLEADGPPRRNSDGSYTQGLRTLEGAMARRMSNGRSDMSEAAQLAASGGAAARVG